MVLAVKDRLQRWYRLHVVDIGSEYLTVFFPSSEANSIDIDLKHFPRGRAHCCHHHKQMSSSLASAPSLATIGETYKSST